MKRSIIGLVAASDLVASSADFAQVSAQITIGQPEQHSIKEYVVKEKVKPVMIKGNVPVGATLPTDVELLAVPSDWGANVSKFRYFYTDNHVVLVEPSSRRIVHIVE